jgi:predicted ATPase with chaperone activity
MAIRRSECRCTGGIIQRYLRKISGPLLDQIDLHVEVSRVQAARAIQSSRGFYNAHIPVRQLRKLCVLDDVGERTLEMAVRSMRLSARAHDRHAEGRAHHRRSRSLRARHGEASGRSCPIPQLGS